MVSKAMFDPKLYPREEVNWCFQEYEAYKRKDALDTDFARNRERLFIFLIDQKPLRDKVGQGNPAAAARIFADLRETYKLWHDHMLGLATTHLEYRSRDKLKAQIESVGERIHEFRHEVLDAMVPEEFAADLVR